jgi:hypothetical protein
MGTERTLQEYLFRKARAAGVMAHKMESRSSRGFPDIAIFYKGRTVLAELKSPTGKGRLSPLQVHTIGKLRGHGIAVRVLHTKEGIDGVIEEITH